MGGMPYSKIIPKHRTYIELNIEILAIFYDICAQRHNS